MDEFRKMNDSLTTTAEYIEGADIIPLPIPLDELINDEATEGQMVGIISDHTLDLFSTYLNFMSASICSCGTIFNTITLIVYFRMGFNDAVNILLFTLAVTDLGAIVPLLWKAILSNPYFYSWELLPIDHITFGDYTAGWPHAMFLLLSAVVTAVVTLDRCLCVVLPLKVKLILTPRRTIPIIAFFVTYIIASIIPVYTYLSIGLVYFPDRNKTLIAFIHAPGAFSVIESTFMYCVIHQTIAYTFIVIVTTILVVQLNKKSAWRKQFYTKTQIPDGKNGSTSNRQANPVTSRDVKVVKMILFISIMYIATYLPTTINAIVMISVKDYNLFGRYQNLLILTWAICNNMIALNSTVNIFIYVKLSSRFAKEFHKMFGCFTDKTITNK